MNPVPTPNGAEQDDATQDEDPHDVTSEDVERVSSDSTPASPPSTIPSPAGECQPDSNFTDAILRPYPALASGDDPRHASDSASQSRPSGLGRLLPRTIRSRTLAAIGCVIVVVAVAVLVAAPWHKPAAPVKLADDGNPVGNDLTFTIEQVSDLLGSASVVFPPSKDDPAEKYMRAEISSPGTFQEHADQALKAGGYLYGGMRLLLDAQAKDNRIYTIYDIHPVVRHGAMVTGDAVLIEPGGAGPNYPIYFNLDQRQPIAEQEVGVDESDQKPFFDLQRPEVTEQEKPTFTMWFNAYLYSAVFTLDVDYDVDGKQYTETVNDDGQPFRATAAPCSQMLGQSGLSAPDKATVTGQHYASIWQLPLDGSDTPAFLSMDQQTYASTCNDY